MSTAESRYSARPDALANDLSGIRPVNAAFLKARQRLLIDGAWVDAASGQTFEVRDPSSDRVITQAALGEAA